MKEKTYALFDLGGTKEGVRRRHSRRASRDVLERCQGLGELERIWPAAAGGGERGADSTRLRPDVLGFRAALDARPAFAIGVPSPPNRLDALP